MNRLSSKYRAFFAWSGGQPIANDDSVALRARALTQQMRGIARQAALDPDDGLGL